MKPLRFVFLSSIAIVCTALLIGCATTQTTTQNRESMLVASGFKVITPKTAKQQQKLQNLPPSKITMIQKRGKTYYIFPDPTHNLTYVGGPKEYQRTNSFVLQTSLLRRISKPPICTRTRPWSGVYGAEGKESGDPREGRVRFRAQ